MRELDNRPKSRELFTYSNDRSFFFYYIMLFKTTSSTKMVCIALMGSPFVGSLCLTSAAIAYSTPMQVHHLCVYRLVAFLNTVIDRQVLRGPGYGIISLLDGEATKWSASIVFGLWSRILACEVRRFLQTNSSKLISPSTCIPVNFSLGDWKLHGQCFHPMCSWDV